MALIFLLLAALVSGVSGQNCPSTPDCRSCLSNQGCYYQIGCNYYTCTSYSGPQCDQFPITNAGNCPVLPTAAVAAAPISSAYWTLSIAFVAAGVLVALLYSPLETLCGQRQSLPAAHGGSRFGSSGVLLLLSCWCLWFGFSLSLAAPALPWLVAVTSPTDLYALTAFNYYECFTFGGNAAAKVCTFYRTLDYIDARNADTASLQYAERGLALGAVGYTVALGLLFPCVLMASLAAYRLRRFEKTGAAPYTSGCSPTSLAVAQSLGWPAFAIISILVFIATSLCSEAAGQLNKYRFSANIVEYAMLPGPVAAGVSMTFQLFGLVLLAVVSRSLSSVQGVGCNGGGCCRLAFDNGGLDPAAPAYVPPQDGAPLLAARAPTVPAYTQPSDGGSQLSVGSA
jgi:hypothetical protein